MRKRIRMDSSFCPQAATTSRALAIHCLTTNRGNVICLYHHILDKGQRVSDEALSLAKDMMEADNDNKSSIDKKASKQKDVKFQVTGIAYNRRIAERGQPAIPMPAGILHCGCSEEDSLLDFWWFKTGEITSPFNGVKEGWVTQYLEPRIRSFLAVMFQGMTGLTINDLYLRDENGQDRRTETRLKLQISRLQARADLLQHAREEAEAAALVELSLLDY